MTSRPGQVRTLDLSLRRLASSWIQGWRELAGWGRGAGLLPRVAVELRDLSGQVVRHRFAAGAGAGKARPPVAALEAPDEGVLLHRLRVPPMSERSVRSALELEVGSVSPFSPEETVWGWRMDRDAGDGRTATLAIASRSHVQDWLDRASRHMPVGAPVEVWARAGEGHVVLQGFDEGVRKGMERRRLLWFLAQLAVAVLLLIALAATPVLQARERVFDAQGRFATIRQDVAEDLQIRDALVQRQQQIDRIRAHFGAQADLVGILGQLTRMLPDDAYLTGFRWNRDGGVVITGLADNAAALIDDLGAEPGLTLLRAPSQISRDRVTGLETFSLTLQLARTEEQ
jgi:general secretion pathway protein L